MSFKIGDLVQGKVGNGYGYTSHKSLCYVRQLDGREMYVEVICHDERNCLNYTGWVNQSKFELKSLEEFLAEYPDCYKNDNRIRRLQAEFSDNKKDIVPYEISDEMRAELLSEMKSLLKKYHYHPTDEALNIIIDEWRTNKADLIRLFEKHPNYNGRFQIAFDYDFDRELDRRGVNNFIEWLFSREVQDNYKKEVKIGDYTYEEIHRELEFLKKIRDVFNYEKRIETVNNTTKEDWTKALELYRELAREYNDKAYVCCTTAYDKELYKVKTKIDKLCDCLYHIIDDSNAFKQFVNEHSLYYFNRYCPDSNVKSGQRLSRAINKILTDLEVNLLENYNREFAKFADSTNPLKIRRHTILSIHPVDYYTMSFGNSWSSCHTIDKKNDRGIDSSNSYRGCNSSGTESYMLDSTSCIFYTVDASSDGTRLELDDKINRCMFHFNDNQLVQGRVYPQSNDNGAKSLYKDIREIVQKIFSDILEVPNLWTNKSGADECEEVVISKGSHYRDYEHFDNCNVSTLKDGRDYHGFIVVGHNPICPCCGEEHNWLESIECEDCF